MEIFEEMGGCVVIGIVAVVALLLVLCVAVVFFGFAIGEVFN